jgi:DNA mismatch repair protein MutL
LSDIIKLLPESVANQIAAGEVIQRPASVIKELVENSVDAKATEIKIILKDAGRTLIQVIDNGIGMSPHDARMSFERHATSKISSAEDIFTIQSKGFRGEALASIAAVAQVDLKTKKLENELGTQIIIEGSEVKKQESIQCADGTNIAVKNLFFNIPVRRNFLKSNNVEYQHILEEIERVALSHPELRFKLYHNEVEQLNLLQGNLRQRITGLFGTNMNERLVPVEEQTDIVKISGFTIKPEFSKKKKENRFLFVNHRFINSNYLNHAIQNAYESLIPEGNTVGYFIFLEVPPATIDINIHPTKTEIKFENEQSIYAILRAGVKQSLGKFQLSPTLDFEREQIFDLPHNHDFSSIKKPEIKFNQHYNPFTNPNPIPSTKNTDYLPPPSFGNELVKKTPQTEHWHSLYNFPKKESWDTVQLKFEKEQNQEVTSEKSYSYFKSGDYLITTLKYSLVFIHIQRALERIIYEDYLLELEQHRAVSQTLMFPLKLQFGIQNENILQRLESLLNDMGFNIGFLGSGTVSVTGIPSIIEESAAEKCLEQIINDEKNHQGEIGNGFENIALKTAFFASIQKAKQINTFELNFVIDKLFACTHPFVSPSGKKIIKQFSSDELNELFK